MREFGTIRLLGENRVSTEVLFMLNMKNNKL